MITEQQILFLNEMIDIKTQLLILAEKFEKKELKAYPKTLKEEALKIDNLLNFLKNYNKRVAIEHKEIIIKTRTVLYRGRIVFAQLELSESSFSSGHIFKKPKKNISNISKE